MDGTLPPAGRTGGSSERQLTLPAAGQHLPPLDGLRGVAIALVLASHCVVTPASGSLGWVVRNAVSIGWVGVDLFFALSGYLITGILLRTRERPHYFRNFYIRRCLRIVPLYLVLVAGVLASAPLLPFGATGPVWPFLTYTSNFWLVFNRLGWLPVPAGYPPLAHVWSLAIEEQFYLVFPLIVFLLDRRRLRATLWAVVALSPLARLAINALIASGQSYFITFGRLDALAMGALIALGLHQKTSIAASSAQRLMWLAGVLTTLAGLLWLTGQTSFHKPFFNLAGLTVVDGAAALIVLAAVIRPVGLLGSLLHAKAIVGLGRISYGVYIIHYPVLLLTERCLSMPPGLGGWLGPLLHAVVSIGVTLLLAGVSWRFLEQPVLQLKRAF
jgi:peptidoglycan/LPS O-acetylase OafA/YrhL